MELEDLKLAQLRAARTLLAHVLGDQDALVWIITRNEILEGRTPLDAIVDGDGARVVRIADALCDLD